MPSSTLGAALRLVLLLLPVLVIAWRGPNMTLAEAAFLLVGAGTAHWLTLAYLSAVRAAHARSMLERPVWWGGFLSGHGLRAIVATVPAIMIAVSILACILLEGRSAFVWIAIPGVLVHVIAAGLLANPAKVFLPYARLSRVILVASFFSALVTSCLAAMTSVTRLSRDWLGLLDLDAVYVGPSPTLAIVASWVQTIAGASEAGQAAAADFGVPPVVVFLWRWLLVFGYSFAVAMTTAITLLSKAELRRVLKPTVQDVPQRLSPITTGFVTAIMTILLMIVLQTLGRIEGMTLAAEAAMRSQFIEPDQLSPPELQIEMTDVPPGSVSPPNLATPSPLSPTGLARIVEAEFIGNMRCPEGTIARIEALDLELAALLEDQRAELSAAIDASFAGMRANVPLFLDWYYSLSAEYLRTLNLLVGNGTDYLQSQFEGHLATGDPMSGLDRVLGTAEGISLVADIHAVERSEALSACGLNLPEDDVIFLPSSFRPESFLVPPDTAVAISLESRLTMAGFGGVAGAISGVVVAKVGAKVIATTTFKLAASALAKIAGSKALSFGGGVLLGAGAGGASGSVVPGAGTTAGAIIGGAVGGLAVMLGVDFTLLEIEEEISRAAFEADILAEIDATETELRMALGL
jgi:hypothetical protein